MTLLATGPVGPQGLIGPPGTVGPVGPQGLLGPSSALAPTPTGNGTGSVTAKSAHSMLVAVTLELAFVVIATMVAGISPSYGSAMLVLMVALLVLRGLFQVNVFGAFVQNNPLSPPASQTSNATPGLTVV